MNKLQNKNTAIVYDRVNKWGGAERTLLALHEIFPDAPLYTAVYDKKGAGWAKIFPEVVPSFLQKIPLANKKHELLSIFTPIAFESMDFSRFDLVISVTSESAKGVITKPGTVHVCYCLTPTRYLYSGYEEYFENPPKDFNFIPFFRIASKLPVAYMKRWDKIAKDRPDKYIAISTEVKKRINRYYKKESVVIFPPNDIKKFKKGAKQNKKKDYYLYVSRLVPYKKCDLAVRAFNNLGKKLVVVGTGSEMKMLKSMAKSNIYFEGFVEEKKLIRLYQQAKGLVFPQIEDFGMVVVEALAAGTPVIAYRGGGAIDTVKEGQTGVFFNKQTPESLALAVNRFEETDFKTETLVNSAKTFSKDKFKEKLVEYMKTQLS